MMWWYGGNGMVGVGYVLMTVGNLLLWLLIALGVMLLLRHGARGASPQHRPTAEDLLAERFARGDITDEEYRHGLVVLRDGVGLDRAGSDGGR